MTTDSLPTPSRRLLNVRTRPGDLELFDRAARVRGETRTQFVLRAARQEATDTLLDHRLVELDPEAFQRFAAALDAPPRPDDRLLRTMRAPDPWPAP
ncbi:MAG: DUF1778 domain-containing protein [Propionibacteriaceae bacterium]|nr:DUF1778 domain-containing protein [Propionibacteriaceae bacterium]